jgi:hypothetical protein
MVLSGWERRRLGEATSLYRIPEKQGRLMVDARTLKKLGSFAIDFAFEGF